MYFKREEGEGRTKWSFFQIYCKAVEKVVCGQWQVLLRCPVRTCLNSLHFKTFRHILRGVNKCVEVRYRMCGAFNWITLLILILLALVVSSVMGLDFNLLVNVPDSHIKSPKFTFTICGLGHLACFSYKLTSEIISVLDI